MPWLGHKGPKAFTRLCGVEPPAMALSADVSEALLTQLTPARRAQCRHIRWDTETLGCVPSLSSIPAMEQRTLVEAMAEVKTWMDQVRGHAPAERRL
jgi:hypothetical protein